MQLGTRAQGVADRWQRAIDLWDEILDRMANRQGRVRDGPGARRGWGGRTAPIGVRPVAGRVL